MDIFENRKIKGIHKSRYVASWINANGIVNHPKVKKGRGPKHFSSWLMTLKINGERLSEEEIEELTNYYCGGKMELERAAVKYLQSKTNEDGLY